MLKRVCDKCGKEIERNEYWYNIPIEKMKNYNIIGIRAGGTHELCGSCYSDLQQCLANKT